MTYKNQEIIINNQNLIFHPWENSLVSDINDKVRKLNDYKTPVICLSPYKQFIDVFFWSEEVRLVEKYAKMIYDKEDLIIPYNSTIEEAMAQIDQLIIDAYKWKAFI